MSLTSKGSPMRSLRAGVAKNEITTTERGVVVHDPLYAKALVLDDGKTKVVLLSLDAVAIGGIGDIGDDFLPKLRNRIQSKLGIPGQNILVHATHTHPPGRLLCEPRKQIDRSFDAVQKALQNLTEVVVGSGIGFEDRLMINRTLRMKNGKGWTVRQAYPCPPDEDVAGVGATDPEIGILRIDRLDGRPLAVVYNYAGHPLLGVPGGGVTANYPGFASGVIEEQLGHGALALFIQGAGGNLTEVLYKDVNRPRDAEPVGVMLGLSTLKTWRTIQTGRAKLAILSETIELPRRTDIPQRIETLHKEQARLIESLRFTSLNFRSFLPLYIKYSLNPEYPSDYSYRYLQGEKIGTSELRALDAENRANLDKYLSNIRAMETLAKIEDDICTLQLHQEQNRASGESTIRAEVQGVRIGDCVLITSPAEVLVEVGLKIKRNSPHLHTFVAAFSNGYVHYGASLEDYEKGGYEVTECMLGSGWQRVYEATTRDILGRLSDPTRKKQLNRKVTTR